MSFTTEQVATNPHTGETHVLMRARVCCVDPSRGDLYVVSFEQDDVLVQLIDGGIANHPETIMNVEMDVMITQHEYFRVVALPIENHGGWRRCRRLRD